MRMLSVPFVTGMVAVGLATGAGATIFAHGTAAANPAPRDVTCSQPIILTEPKVSSEVNDAAGIESEVANDCYAPTTGTITRVTWWGGYIDGDEPAIPVTTFNLQFYTDAECRPDLLILEYEEVSPAIVEVGVDSLGYPTYMFEMDVSVPIVEGIFWFAGQAVSYMFPPQHGRGGDGSDFGKRLCESMFRGAVFGYPDWTPISDVIGRAWEASQEFEFEPGAIPSRHTRWGTVKALYR